MFSNSCIDSKRVIPKATDTASAMLICSDKITALPVLKTNDSETTIDISDSDLLVVYAKLNDSEKDSDSDKVLNSSVVGMKISVSVIGSMSCRSFCERATSASENGSISDNGFVKKA